VKWKTDRVAGLEIYVKGGSWAERQTYPLSLLPAPYFKVETDHSIPIAQRHDRNSPGQVVLHLDDLLVRN
jgi:hypothetical protein